MGVNMTRNKDSTEKNDFLSDKEIEELLSGLDNYIKEEITAGSDDDINTNEQNIIDEIFTGGAHVIDATGEKDESYCNESYADTGEGDLTTVQANLLASEGDTHHGTGLSGK